MARYRSHAGSVFARLQWKGALLFLITVTLCAFGVLAFFPSDSVRAQTAKSNPKRAVTVADGIELTRLGDSEYWAGASSEGRVAHFSPDRKQFVIVLQKGNLQNNTNEYSLLLYKTAEAFASPSVNVLLKMASSSNRPAISQVQWLADNRTLLFLGENPDELPQVVSLDTRSKRIRRLTRHPLEIYSFRATSKADEIVFLAQPSPDLADCRERTRRSGFVVTDENLSDLVRDPCQVSPENQRLAEAHLQTAGSKAQRIVLPNLVRNDGPLLLSPNGRYALAGEAVKECPANWRSYRASYVQECFAGNVRPGGRARYWLRRYVLIDLKQRHARVLLDVPSLLYLPEAIWAEDSRSVRLNQTYLPLDVRDPTELEERQKNRYNAIIAVPGGSYQKVAKSEEAAERNGSPIDVTLEESFNIPFRIYVSEHAGGRKELLLDLNPQLSAVDLGPVELFEWKDPNGRSWRGGLYLPTRYVVGKRYPLVIQTHGFSPLRFSIDGLNDWASAFAARPLAADGFIVLQAGDWSFNSVEEGPNLAAEYEAAIDALDSRELIDRSRVGISGFSRTVYSVGYALTHSSFHYGAAVLADGIDASYFSYVAGKDSPDVIRLNNGKPFGEGLRSWLERAPCFNLDKVRTPIWFLSFSDSGGVLQNWEWFSVLQRLNKPIELILLPAASHQLVKPWERFTAQQGLVDWFRFWLKDEEDPAVAKKAQYVRWRELRHLHAMDAISPGSSVTPAPK